MGIGPLLHSPHLLRAGLVLLTLLFFPLVPLSYWVLCGSKYSLPLVRYSCLLSAGVLHALLCLILYSWCFHGERCTPHLPTPLPSCSPSPQPFFFSCSHICIGLLEKNIVLSIWTYLKAIHSTNILEKKNSPEYSTLFIRYLLWRWTDWHSER